MNNINVVYTPWANLKKTGDMDVGQIGFHRQKEVSSPKKGTPFSTFSAALTLSAAFPPCGPAKGEDRGGGEEGQ